VMILFVSSVLWAKKGCWFSVCSMFFWLWG
jgi:hypothetical protein